MTPAEILEKLDSHAYLVPDTRTYNMIVDTAIKRGKNRLEGPHFAEAVLDRMNTEAKKNPAVSPDSVMHNTVINAWGKSGLKEAPYRAEVLLQRKQDMYDTGDEKVKPNTIGFNSVINAWARSNDRMAAERAEVILNRMQELFESDLDQKEI
jgi:hypothetical protein